MNQQCIFNQDFTIDEAAKAVSCSCLHQGLRRQIFIEMPDGWQLNAWLAQVVEDGFFWEEEIEQAVARERFEADGSIHLHGAA
jgi:hypothetical protein